VRNAEIASLLRFHSPALYGSRCITGISRVLPALTRSVPTSRLRRASLGDEGDRQASQGKCARAVAAERHRHRPANRRGLALEEQSCLHHRVSALRCS
jgi:hypothetical protein